MRIRIRGGYKSGRGSERRANPLKIMEDPAQLCSAAWGRVAGAIRGCLMELGPLWTGPRPKAGLDRAAIRLLVLEMDYCVLLKLTSAPQRRISVDYRQDGKTVHLLGNTKRRAGRGVASAKESSYMGALLWASFGSARREGVVTVRGTKIMCAALMHSLGRAEVVGDETEFPLSAVRYPACHEMALYRLVLLYQAVMGYDREVVLVAGSLETAPPRSAEVYRRLAGEAVEKCNADVAFVVHAVLGSFCERISASALEGVFKQLGSRSVKRRLGAVLNGGPPLYGFAQRASISEFCSDAADLVLAFSCAYSTAVITLFYAEARKLAAAVFDVSEQCGLFRCLDDVAGPRAATMTATATATATAHVPEDAPCFEREWRERRMRVVRDAVAGMKLPHPVEKYSVHELTGFLNRARFLKA